MLIVIHIMSPIFAKISLFLYRRKNSILLRRDTGIDFKINF